MLTPEFFFQPFTTTGQDLDFLNPILSNYFRTTTTVPFFPPTTRNYLLVPNSTNGYSELNSYT